MKPSIKKISYFLLAACLLLSPLFSICQPPPPNEGGGNPEVPFDSNMNLVFLAIAIFFAAYTTNKKIKSKKLMVK